MLEHLRFIASLNSRSSGDPHLLPLLVLMKKHVLWMQKMDITPFDFSYLGGLLEQAYSDWNSRVGSRLARPSTFYSVWNTESD